MADAPSESLRDESASDRLEVLRSELTDVQKLVFDQLWLHLLDSEKPLPVRTLQRAIGKANLADVLLGVSGCLLFEINENGRQCLKLTLLGALLSSQGQHLYDLLTGLLEVVKETFEAGDDSQDLKSDAICMKLNVSDVTDESVLFHLLGLGLLGPWPFRTSAFHHDRTWTIQITDSVVDLYRADSVEPYLQALLFFGYNETQPWSERERLQQFPWPPSAGGLDILVGEEPVSKASEFVNRPLIDGRRLDELRALHNPRFDCSRLVALCSELADCSARGHVHASIMLTRAILDHVPPVFDCKSFKEVANNYGGEKSFRDAMGHLDTFGKAIAHLHLHAQIKDRHSLPTMTQVDFAAPLDLLLGEIAKILSTPSNGAGE